jgi:hypothetical protein
MVSLDRFRKLALSLPDTTEVPHMERQAFRTPRKIFATLAPDGLTANLMLTLELQAGVVDALPDAFHPVAGGWGKMGATTVILRKVKLADLERILSAAHSIAAEPLRKKKKRRQG